MKFLLAITDVVSVVVAMLFANIAHGWLRDFVPFLRAKVAFQEYSILVYLAIPLWLTLIRIFKADQVARTLPRAGELAWQLFKVHFFGTAVIALVSFAGRIVINRSVVLLFLVALFAVLFAERWAIVAYQRYQHRTGQSRQRILILGDATETLSAYVAGARGDSPPAEIVGVLSDAPPGPTLPAAAALPRLGNLAQLEAVLHNHPVDRVVFLPPYNKARDYPGTFELCELRGIEATLLVDTMDRLHSTPRIMVEHDLPFMTYELAPKSDELMAIKGLLDFVIALSALVVLAPLLAAVALAIRISMGRPVFFVQDRIGLNGRLIRVFKFRTMVPGAEQRRDELLEANEMDGPVFKLARDPRVTGLGRFLRRTSIDELPQLFNVLRGEMSLVGPRPLPVREQREIRGLSRRRLSMKPGITGLWQVSGRNEIGFDEWMRLDRRYVEQWSLILDAKILFRTVAVVVTGRGAS